MTAASDISGRLGKLTENLGLVSKGLLGSQQAVDASGFLATCAEVESLLAEATALPPPDRKSTRLNSSHTDISRIPSSA